MFKKCWKYVNHFSVLGVFSVLGLSSTRYVLSNSILIVLRLSLKPCLDNVLAFFVYTNHIGTMILYWFDVPYQFYCNFNMLLKKHLIWEGFFLFSFCVICISYLKKFILITDAFFRNIELSIVLNLYQVNDNLFAYPLCC